jgi:ADP-ribose pyrophosphatase
MSDREFQRTGGRTAFEGHIIRVDVDTFRFADGEEVERDIVRHPGAVGIVAHDGTHVYLVRQPRPAVGDPDCLEIPAGLLDADHEAPAETAQRELMEEIGKRAGHIEPLRSYFSSVGSFDEVVHLYLATHLSDQQEDSGENERIEVVRWPLADLDAAIAATWDVKTVLGLMLLRDRLAAG